MSIINVWGPKLWYLIHIVAYQYPENPSELYKTNYKLFYINIIPDVIPCSYCKMHYMDYLKKNNINHYLNNRIKLIEWTINAHNNVNKQKGKYIFSLEEANVLYNKPIHIVLYQLLKYYYDTSTENYLNFVRFKLFVQNFSIYFPCLNCRKKLIQAFQKTNSLYDINRIVKYVISQTDCL